MVGAPERGAGLVGEEDPGLGSVSLQNLRGLGADLTVVILSMVVLINN